jgi:hypothetical protein
MHKEIPIRKVPITAALVFTFKTATGRPSTEAGSAPRLSQHRFLDYCAVTYFR